MEGYDSISSDNRPIDANLVVAPYKQNAWHLTLPPGAHVVARSVLPNGYGPDDRKGVLNSVHAMTPTQLNVVLHETAKERWKNGQNPYYAWEAASDWKYRGIVVTPSPPQSSILSNLKSTRVIVVRFRTDEFVDNYWGNVKGDDRLFFVFRNVDCRPNEKGLKVSSTDARTFDHGNMRSYPQIFAVRVQHDQCQDVTSDYKDLCVPVFVGRCVRNLAYTPNGDESIEDDPNGSLCRDDVVAHAQHIDAMILAC